MIQVLVTGANGQLGMAIRAVATEYPGINFVFKSRNELDITDSEMLANLWKYNSFDYCINCAAFTDVERAEREPEKAFLVNAEGVKRIAEKCQEHNCILIHISTDYVFDGEKDGAYLPMDTPNPINEYGKSKLLGEKYIMEILNEYFIVRTSWLYSEYGKNFYTTILKKAKTEKKIFVTDEQKGNPTRAGHLARFIIDIISGGEESFGIYHFTDGETMTWLEFAKKIIKEKELDKEVKIVKAKNYRTFAQRPINSNLK